MRLISCTFVCCICLITFLSLKTLSENSLGFDNTVEHFKTNATEFADECASLKVAIERIDSRKPETIINARAALVNCRLSYKKIECFIEYFFKSNAIFYNGPPKFEIEEPYMEWQTPIGLQVIESLLFDKDVHSKKKELSGLVDALASSSTDLHSLLHGFDANDQQILESIRLQLLRIYTLGITGFDAPLLKTGIKEAFVSLKSLQISLSPFLQHKSLYADSVSLYMQSCLKVLQEAKSFDSFDRLTFFVSNALPLQKYLGLLIKEMHLEHNTTGGVLNYNASNIFRADAININAFTNTTSTPALIELGRNLFNYKGLSGNNRISCATCHQPEKHFTDGLQRSVAFDGHSKLKRNAPSLLYAAFQYEQFWDGRAKSLEEQIEDVLLNPHEMNFDSLICIERISTINKYDSLLIKAFPANKNRALTLKEISASIAAYVSILNPLNSPFDKYMEGDKRAITPAQMRGFNLFMGKAQCGTCHFAPLFNGLVPPLYAVTELEVLGTSKTDDMTRPEQDGDKGRYDVFPIEFYKQAFKTPTVRNVSATAPYMHNGSFKTLEKVVEFYNKGGGAGIGLKVKNQTLPSTPLNLSKGEVSDIVLFMHALKDSIVH